jgi:hypothetical protein
VLDIGGGPATHARWLMADGYSVHLIDPVERHLQQARSPCSCTTELGDARAFTYFHTAEELISEMTEAGFTNVRLYGIEGPLWPVLKGVETHTGDSLTGSPLLSSASTAARLTETDPAIIAASAHIMAIGYRGPSEDR